MLSVALFTSSYWALVVLLGLAQASQAEVQLLHNFSLFFRLLLSEGITEIQAPIRVLLPGASNGAFL